MTAKVYSLKIQNPEGSELVQVGKKIFNVFQDFFSENDRVAIKVHFGERASTTRLSPVFVKAVFEELKMKVKEAVLMDCTVLYKGERAFGTSHKKLAFANGFDFAPVIIADGEKGEQEMLVDVGLKHFQKVRLGSALENFNSILAITHFTGHSAAGIGGALKNVGMGLGSKAGKLEMHKAFSLKINPEKCRGCGQCQKECPGNAIILENKKARINFQKCLHCGRCIAECPVGAIEIPWGDASSRDLQEKIVEYAFGILKGRKAFFVNVLLNITNRCDCVRELQAPFLPDIGILASDDIVAIDKASLDLAGKENFMTAGINPEDQIDYASKLGLGKKEYELIAI